jgi:Nuclease-related domain
MANLHTDLPEGKAGFWGEHQFATALSAFPDDWNLWFQVDYLPNTNEIDSLIVHQSFGAFVIEVKGHTLNEIDTYARGIFKTRANPGRSAREERPISQAKKITYQLKQYIDNIFQQSIWLQVAVAFPNISRSEWEGRFGTDHQIAGFIFKDDLTINGVSGRLAYLMENPTQGGAAQRRRLLDQELLQNAMDAFNGRVAKPKITAEERQALVSPKDKFVERAHEYLDFQGGVIQVQGKAGSGKTLLLYKWAEARAAKGERVLLLTFNKTLASELRRQIFAVQENQKLAGELDIYDIYDLVYTGFPKGAQLDYSKVANVANGYIKNFLLRLRSGAFDWEPYDAIAIDEGQDFLDEYLEAVEKVSKPETPWMIAYGHKQELYRVPGEWPFEAIERRGFQKDDVINLRRLFRNAKGSSLIAWAFEENFPNLEKGLNRVSSELANRSEDDDQLALFNLERDESKIVFRPYTKHVWHLEQLLEEFLDIASKTRRPDRPMIIVQAEGSFEHKQVAKYLEERSIPYMDLVERDNRRKLAPDGHVRIITAHSARGIEAESVLLFGLEPAERNENGSDDPPESMAQKAPDFSLARSYVGLTRHKWRLTIAADPKIMSDIEKLGHSRFIYELNQLVRRQALD